MDAAIQEAVKDIPYFSGETVSKTIDFGTQTTSYTSKSIALDDVDNRIKRFDITISISVESRVYQCTGHLILPAGGTYLRIYDSITDSNSNIFEILSGETELLSVSASGGMGAATENNTGKFYLTRLS